MMGPPALGHTFCDLSTPAMVMACIAALATLATACAVVPCYISLVH